MNNRVRNARAWSGAFPEAKNFLYTHQAKLRGRLGLLPSGCRADRVSRALASIGETKRSINALQMVGQFSGPTGPLRLNQHVVSKLKPKSNGFNYYSSCSGLPSYSALKAALTAARMQSNGGFNLDMWGTIVNRDGIVCAVAFTGADRGSQWPGSRVISAQKANTANAFSLPASFALDSKHL